MAALTAERNTTRLGRTIRLHAVPLKAATRVFAGSLVVSDAGFLAPGRTATGLIAAGVARETYDNLAGAAGAVTGEAEAGTFPFANSTAGDLIAQADVGNDCFIVDDQTVAKTNGGSTRSRAGKITEVLADGSVAVLVGFGL